MSNTFMRKLFAVRWCSNGVISSLERFFSWYGCLVASHPWTSILICLALTVGGGLGLLRSVSVSPEICCNLNNLKVL